MLQHCAQKQTSKYRVYTHKQNFMCNVVFNVIVIYELWGHYTLANLALLKLASSIIENEFQSTMCYALENSGVYKSIEYKRIHMYSVHCTRLINSFVTLKPKVDVV